MSSQEGGDEKEGVAAEKSAVDANQFFIGRKENEKWKQWMSTENLKAGDEISVEFSEEEQYWRFELHRNTLTWSFYVIRSGKKLYVSYDDTDKVTLEEDGNKERNFKILLQIDGRFLIKTTPNESGEDRILSVDSDGKLALLRGVTSIKANEWFILKYFINASGPFWFPVPIQDLNSDNWWDNSEARKNDEIPLAKGNALNWLVKVESHKVIIVHHGLCVSQMDKQEVIIMDDLHNEPLQSSGRDRFRWADSSSRGGLLLESPVDPTKYLSMDDDEKYVVLKKKRDATTWAFPLISIWYKYKGQVKYYPPIEDDKCVLDNDEEPATKRARVEVPKQNAKLPK